METVEPTAPASARKLEQERLLTDREVADLLGCGLQTVRNWRQRGVGPAYIRVGARLVRYAPDAVRAFLHRDDHEAA